MGQSDRRVRAGSNVKFPAFGGLKTSLAYGFGEQDNSPREGFSSVGLEYTTGPLRLGYVFQGISNIGGTSTDQREHFLGASYNFGMVTVIDSSQNARVDASGASAASDKVWNVGAKVMVAPATHVLLGYAKPVSMRPTVTARAIRSASCTRSRSARTSMAAADA